MPLNQCGTWRGVARTGRFPLSWCWCWCWCCRQFEGGARPSRGRTPRAPAQVPRTRNERCDSPSATLPSAPREACGCAPDCRTRPVDPKLPLTPGFFSQPQSLSARPLRAEAPQDTIIAGRTMLDIASSVRVHLDAFIAEQHDMGVCDAIEESELGRESPPMSTPHVPKVAGINPTLSPPPQTAPVDQLAAVQDRLAGWISDLTTLHELTERLARTATLDAALQELLSAGAALVGARRGLVALDPDGRPGPRTHRRPGPGPADLGHLETVPRESASYARLIDGMDPEIESVADPGDVFPGAGEGGGSALPGIVHTDIPADEALDPLHREVAARLGYAASYAVPLATQAGSRARGGRLALRRARRAHRAPAPSARPLRAVRRPNSSPGTSS